MSYLPKIKSDLDSLERLAASFYDASASGRQFILFHSDGSSITQHALKIRLAIMDIQNLRDALTEEWS